MGIRRNILKRIEKWTSDQLAKDETRHNWPGIKNGFFAVESAVAVAADAVKDEIHSAWSSNGANLVQRIVAVVNPNISDTAEVMKKILDDRFDTMKERDNRSDAKYSNLLGIVNATINSVGNKVGDYFEQLIRGGEELSRQSALEDQSNHERTTQTQEQIRLLRMKVEEYQSLNYKTHLSLYNDLVGRIQELKSPDKQHFNSAPTKEWLFDNMDALIEAVEAMIAVRENNTPRSTTVYEAVRRFRKLELYGASDIRDEIESLTNRWDNDQPNIRLVS